jgi:hypothetical protein
MASRRSYSAWIASRNGCDFVYPLWRSMHFSPRVALGCRGGHPRSRGCPVRCQAPPGTRAVARSAWARPARDAARRSAGPTPLSLHTGTRRDIIRAHLRAPCAVAAMTARGHGNDGESPGNTCHMTTGRGVLDQFFCWPLPFSPYWLLAGRDRQLRSREPAAVTHVERAFYSASEAAAVPAGRAARSPARTACARHPRAAGQGSANGR